MIIRSPNPQSNFVILSKAVTENENLSWAARGLLIFLLGKPSNWKISIEHLMLQTKNSAKYSGKDSIYSLLNELINHGYVVRSDKQSHDENGRLCGYDYVVYDSPCRDNTDKVSPCLPLPCKAQPYKANPPLISNDLEQVLNLNIQTNTHEKKTEQAIVDELTKETSVNFLMHFDWQPNQQEFEGYCKNLYGIDPKKLTPEIFKKFVGEARSNQQKHNESKWCKFLAAYLKKWADNPQFAQQPNQHIYRPNGNNQFEQPLAYEVPNKIKVEERGTGESDEVRARMARSLDGLLGAA